MNFKKEVPEKEEEEFPTYCNIGTLISTFVGPMSMTTAIVEEEEKANDGGVYDGNAANDSSTQWCHQCTCCRECIDTMERNSRNVIKEMTEEIEKTVCDKCDNRLSAIDNRIDNLEDVISTLKFIINNSYK